MKLLEPFEPEPKEEAEAPEPVEGPIQESQASDSEVAEPVGGPTDTNEKVNVNPADVPMEVVKPQGDGIQMDLFDNEV